MLRDIQFFLNYTCHLPHALVYPIWHIKNFFFCRKFPVGSYVEDCRFHPCIVTKNDGLGDIEVISLCNSTFNSCSLYHCGIVRLTEEQVREYIKAYKEGGNKALAMKNGWSEKDYDEFEKEWRS